MSNKEHYLSNVLLTDEDRAQRERVNKGMHSDDWTDALLTPDEQIKRRIMKEETKKSAENGKHYLSDILNVSDIPAAVPIKKADKKAEARRSVAVVFNNLLAAAEIGGLEYEEMNEKETGLYDRIMKMIVNEFSGGEEI